MKKIGGQLDGQIFFSDLSQVKLSSFQRYTTGYIYFLRSRSFFLHSEMQLHFLLVLLILLSPFASEGFHRVLALSSPPTSSSTTLHTSTKRCLDKLISTSEPENLPPYEDLASTIIGNWER